MQKPSVFQQLKKSSYLTDNNACYIESLYEDFLHDRNVVDSDWCQYFETLGLGQVLPDATHLEIRRSLKGLHRKATCHQAVAGSLKQVAVYTLIENYRQCGHIDAELDPLSIHARTSDPLFSLHNYGLDQSDLKQAFDSQGLLDASHATLQEIIERLRHIYCGTVGIEYNRIDESEYQWLRHRVESGLRDSPHDPAMQRNILKQLIASEMLEKYLDKRYIAQVRFSLEGGDSLIPMLDQLIQRARAEQVEEMVIGMAHRGRINVLLNIMGQSPTELFQEFEGKKDYGLTSGDVKYHRG